MQSDCGSITTPCIILAIFFAVDCRSLTAPFVRLPSRFNSVRYAIPGMAFSTCSSISSGKILSELLMTSCHHFRRLPRDPAPAPNPLHPLPLKPVETDEPTRFEIVAHRKISIAPERLIPMLQRKEISHDHARFKTLRHNYPKPLLEYTARKQHKFLA